MTYRIVLWLAVTMLLGHVCGLEGTRIHAPHVASWASSADAHPAEAEAIHDASCEGLKPTSVSPDVGFLGTQPHAASDDTIAAPARGVWTLSPPARRAPLFVLHGALLI
jgi:hypothetical protein